MEAGFVRQLSRRVRCVTNRWPSLIRQLVSGQTEFDSHIFAFRIWVIVRLIH